MKKHYTITFSIICVLLISSCNQPKYTQIGGDDVTVKLLDNETGRVLIFWGGSDRCFEYDLKTREYKDRSFYQVDSFTNEEL